MGAVRLAILGLLLAGLSAEAAFASAASPTVTAAVGLPAAAAPTGTLFPLAAVGYQASEFFLSGNASTFHNDAPLTADGVWTTAADVAQTAYKTRIQVYRPSDAADFNGTVYVEWLNVTNASDTAADWLVSHIEMTREGAVYVGVTAQLVGVNAALNREPGRYGAAGANLVHPGDSYSYDIYSQAGQALRDNAALILDGLAPAQLIAIGESQSASRMVTYIDGIAPLHQIYDGYLVHSRGANGTALRATPAPPIAAPANTLLRTDLGVPIFVFQTETDTRATRQPDSSVFRQWEVPGSAHVDMYTLGIGQFDTGADNSGSLALFDRMLNPTNDPLPGILPACSLPVNSGPHHWALEAATHALNEWVVNGTPPPTAPPIATAGGVPTAAPVLDANGNVMGGVRTPHVDSPVATIRGTGQSGSGFCVLFGTTAPLSVAQRQALYTKQSLFVAAWNQATDNAVANGWVLAADAPRLKAPAPLRQVVPKIPLTVTPDSQLVPVGSPDPAFTATLTGFVLSDTAATLDTPPTCGVAGPHDTVGTYAITCSGGADDDYSFDYAPGTLEVTYSISGGGGCGIGPELALLAPALAWLRRRRGRVA